MFLAVLNSDFIMWIHKTILLHGRLLKLATVCALVAASFVAQCQNADQDETKIVSIENLGKTSVLLQPSKIYTLEITQDESRLQEIFPDDWLMLRVKDKNQKLVASKPFHSSYQKFHISIVDLDGDGQKEFVFALGEGRGTSARRETLYIEHFDGFQFKQILATPLSDFYASGRRWWYSIEFKHADEGGTTDLLLQLHTDDDSAKSLTQDGIPAEQIKIFKWRTKDGSKQLDGESNLQPKVTK